jgi:iron complex outermembrane receptor protein
MDTANVVTDQRGARNFDNPHHTIYINLFTSQNSLFLSNSIVRVNLGAHLNRRMEDEGGSGISLDMQLLTAFVHAQYEHPLNQSLRLLTGIQSQFQNNQNFGVRVIVPNANLLEASGYAYLRYESQHAGRRHIIAEGGFRYDLRMIKTFVVYEQTVLQAYFIPTVSKIYNVVNGSAGISVPLGEHVTIRGNVTSGYRTPNLAELQSNGVHEGTLRYELGDPAMKIEQNICAEAGLEFNHSGLRISAAGFYNYFRNYIYLLPTNEDWFGFRIYKFVQTDAVLQGAECSAEYTPEKWQNLRVELNYSLVRAVTGEGNYLPFIPADRLDGNIRYTLRDRGAWKGIYFRIGAQYYFPQDRPAQFESSTPDYGLADAGFGFTRALNKSRGITLDLGCNNIFNNVYYDHLSRFKEFGIYNMGRNITLNFKYNW